MTRPGDNKRISERVRPVLNRAGYTDEQGRLTPLGVDDALVACLMAGLRMSESADPWGEPFALIIGAGWCGIDGADPGDVQVRFTQNGMQLRERVPILVACAHIDHLADGCENCWNTSMLRQSDQWHPVTARIKVRAPEMDMAADTCRLEVQRREPEGEGQAEALWSEPWGLPHWGDKDSPLIHEEKVAGSSWESTSWVDVTSDVQISDGHTFPRGILVRRATGDEDAPWTSPSFLPETHWEWADLVPDGSLQFRCWKAPGSERFSVPYRIEARQRVGRKPFFVVEPVWGKTSSSWGDRRYSTNGYTLELLRENTQWRSVRGVRVTFPGSRRTFDVLVTNRWIQVMPDLLVEASSQGSFCWKNGTYEPQVALLTRTIPETIVLRHREWTMLGEMVRAKISSNHAGVVVEILGDELVRRHWWSRRSLWLPGGVKPFGTAHDLGGAVRVTFRPDHVAEVQHCVL